MENIQLTSAELHVLKTIVSLESEKHTNLKGVDLNMLYGKLNVLWGESRKEARTIA